MPKESRKLNQSVVRSSVSSKLDRLDMKLDSLDTRLGNVETHVSGLDLAIHNHLAHKPTRMESWLQTVITAVAGATGFILLVIEIARGRL